MARNTPNGWYLKDGILGINIFFLSITIAWINLGLKIKDIGLVWLPTSDLLSSYLQSSGRQDNNNRWNYPRLNLPTQSDLGANMSPQFDWVHEAILRMLNLVTRNPIASVNLWILLSFGFVGLFAFFLMRQIGVGKMIATASSLTFALLPYHFLQFDHATIIQYQWTICLIFIVIVTVDRDLILLSDKYVKWCTFFSALFISGSGAYAVFFALIFMFLFTLMKIFSLEMERRSAGKMLTLVWPMLFLSTCTAIQAVIFRFSLNSDRQQLLFPVRAGGDSSLYSTRLFEFLLPSTTSHWYKPFFAWIGNKIQIPSVNFCPPGRFSKFAAEFICDSKPQGGSYGSVLSTFCVYFALVAGLYFLVFHRGRILPQVRALFGILIISLLINSTYGFGTLISALVPAARKPAVLVPVITIAFILITAIIAQEVFLKSRKIPQYAIVFLVLAIFGSDTFTARYRFITETRMDQEIIQNYAREVDRVLPSNCMIMKIPLDQPKQIPATVSPSAYVPYFYASKASWVFVDPQVTGFEQKTKLENLRWIVASARLRGYCALELTNADYVSKDAMSLIEVANFLESDAGLRILVASKDLRLRLYSLDTGKINGLPQINILSGGYEREPVASGGNWRWVRNDVSFQVLSSEKRCVQMSTHVASFGGRTSVKFSLNNSFFLRSPTDVDISVYITLMRGFSNLRIQTSTADTIIPTGRKGAAYLFDPILNLVSENFCS